MATDTSVNSTSNAPAAQVQQELDAVRTLTNSGIVAISRVQQARLTQSTRALATLTAQLDAKDAAVIALAAAIGNGRVKVSQVQAMQRQLSVPQADVPTKGWVLQGHLLDPEYRPLARHTVYFVDERKAFLPQYSFAYTDQAGYFSLSFNGANDNAAMQSLFVAVVDVKAHPVYLASDPFTPTIGQASYQQILVAEGEPILGDPPEAIRRVAIPEDAMREQSQLPPDAPVQVD